MTRVWRCAGWVWVIVACGMLSGLSQPAAAEEEPPRNTGAIGIEAGADYTTSYFFRGYLQEDGGLIVQPWAQLNISLIERDDWSLDGYIGIWNSLHTRHTDSGALRPPIDPDHVITNRAWYEFDFYTGLDFTVGDFTIGLIYTRYTSPSHAFASLDEIGASLTYDDSALWGDRDFALNPYVAVYFETKGGSSAYGEVGIVPGFGLDFMDMTVEVPIIVGFSIDDYYVDADGNDDTFGYFSLGLVGSIPLPMPTRYGAWELSAGVHWLHLNADVLRDLNDGSRNEVIGTVGVSFSY